MLLTISTTHQPATDLGYLLAKHPARTQRFQLSFGDGYVFFPEATNKRCTVALIVDVDPIRLVRSARRMRKSDAMITQYVNDRPYVSSSLTSTAMSRIFGSALGGRCEHRPELANQDIPLTATMSVLPSRGGESFLRRLFEPLGYEVKATPIPVDSHFPNWGLSRYFTVQLSAHCRLDQLLKHLYVLIPVLDDEKHYWVGDEEVEKLMAKAGDWIATHPMRDQILKRYLKHQASLTRLAAQHLADRLDCNSGGNTAAISEGSISVEKNGGYGEQSECSVQPRLNDQRYEAVLAVLKARAVSSVIDLGCSEGKFLRKLVGERSLSRIVGVDVSVAALERAKTRLHLESAPFNAQTEKNISQSTRNRIELLHGSLTYRDDRFSGFDAACLIEVIEHLESHALQALEAVVFKYAAPKTVIVTTPNVEYNSLFENLDSEAMRHGDHRFEWTRDQFQLWAASVASQYNYTVKFEAIGPVDSLRGGPTQMAIFYAIHVEGR